MGLKTIILFILVAVVGVVVASYSLGGLFLSQVIPYPFETVAPPILPAEQGTLVPVTTDSPNVSFLTGRIQEDFIPWVIKQVSILIGALSLVVFFYAGVQLIIAGDNEEQMTKSLKMLVFGVIGIALAAFSYTIVANILALFNSNSP
ncbi:MAG: hypothetical protein Q8O95_01485 [bacterium]|nr:hypothetical protein [bacterium]